MIRPTQYDRGNIYLSGGMQFAKELGAAWRITASEKLKKMKYFPIDITELDVAYNENHGKITSPVITLDKPVISREEMLYHKATWRKHFVKTDIDLVEQNSDALIVYYDESARRGAGTVSEAQSAFNAGVPIFLVCEYPNVEELYKNVSGWLIALATKTFLSFDELYEYLDKLPYGILKKDVYGNHCVGNQYMCHLTGDIFTKRKSKFVSNVNPLYSQEAVKIVSDVHEKHKDRYHFFMEKISKDTGTDFTSHIKK